MSTHFTPDGRFYYRLCLPGHPPDQPPIEESVEAEAIGRSAVGANDGLLIEPSHALAIIVPTTIIVRTAAASSMPVPQLIADAGEHASMRFIDFFTANVRNPNTPAPPTRSLCARFFPGPNLDLIVTMDDATSAITSIFLCEQEGTTLSACRKRSERGGCFRPSTPIGAVTTSPRRRRARRSIRRI